MLKKVVSFMLAILLMHSGALTAWADERPEDAAKRIAKAKTEVAKRGTGPTAGVIVKLLDGVELRGYIAESKEEEFTVHDPVPRKATVIRYQDVAKVKKWEQGGSGSKVARGLIIGGVAVGLTALTIISLRKIGNIGKINFPPCFPNCPPTP